MSLNLHWRVIKSCERLFGGCGLRLGQTQESCGNAFVGRLLQVLAFLYFFPLYFSSVSFRSVIWAHFLSRISRAMCGTVCTTVHTIAVFARSRFLRILYLLDFLQRVVMLGFWVERENSIFRYVGRSKRSSRSLRGGSCEGRCPCDESGKGYVP